MGSGTPMPVLFICDYFFTGCVVGLVVGCVAGGGVTIRNKIGLE